MKKQGFTLAEVLITLGIIGVVAALTTPALVQNAGTAKVGPSLAKAVNTIELAHETMLTDLGETRLANLSTNYTTLIQNYMKGGTITFTSSDYSPKSYDGTKDAKSETGAITSNSDWGNTLPTSSAFLSKEGMIYYPRFRNGMLSSSGRTNEPPHKQGIGTYLIDINGLRLPNRMGQDIFMFTLWNDGSLKPVGGTDWSPYDRYTKTWQDYCNATSVTSGWYCAGSIFENNLKVIY